MTKHKNHHDNHTERKKNEYLNKVNFINTHLVVSAFLYEHNLTENFEIYIYI